MWIQEGAILDLLFTWVGGGRQNDSATAPDPDLMGLLGIELGLCTPSRFRSVCRSHRLSGCLCLLLLTPPQSQRILFSTTQMFSVVCCAALSCVYNKEVLVWRWRKAVRWGSECRWGGGVHCTVGVNTEWCQLSLGPPTSQYSIVFPSFPPSISFFIFQRDRCLWILAPWHWKTVFTSKEKYDFPHIFNVQILDQYQSLSPTDAAYLYLGTLGWLLQ